MAEENFIQESNTPSISEESAPNINPEAELKEEINLNIPIEKEEDDFKYKILFMAKHHIKFEAIISKEKVNDVMEMIAEKIKPQVKIKGFRKNKLKPKNIIDVHFNFISGKAVNIILDYYLNQTMSKNDILIANTIYINGSKISYDRPFSIQAEFEIYPNIDNFSLKDEEVVQYEIEITEEDLKNEYKKFLHNKRAWQKVDREAAIGDKLTLNISETKKEQQEDIALENVDLIIGEGNLSNELSNFLVGLTIDEEKIFKYKLPDNYFIKTVAGQTIEVYLKVLNIQEPVAIETINADFLHKNGIEVSEEAANDEAMCIELLEKYIDKNIRNAYKDKLNSKNGLIIFDKIYSLNKFEIPEHIKRKYKDFIYKNRVAGINNLLTKISNSDYLNKNDISFEESEVEENAEKLSIYDIISGVLINKLKISLTDVEKQQLLALFLSHYTAANGVNVDQLNQSDLEKILKKEKDKIDFLLQKKLNIKLLKILLKDAIIKKQTISVKQLEEISEKMIY